MRRPRLALASLACLFATATASSLPVVVWHGLGDRFDAKGLTSLADYFRESVPDLFVYFVRLSDDGSQDAKSSFFGNAAVQVAQVAQDLRSQPELARGFHGIGFSQGGVLLRAYAEVFNDPPVKNLITLGSPHMGVSELPPCRPGDLVCRASEWALRAGVYTDYAQTSVVPAQYFRNQDDIAPYLRKNLWLRLINNERWGDGQVGGSEDYLDEHESEGADESERNATYADNLASLSNLVLIRFTKDITVIPAASTQFGLLNLTSEQGLSIPMHSLPIYKRDYIGLRRLDQAGKIQFESCVGAHMEIDQACLDLMLHWIEPSSAKNAFVIQS
ncbi:uncharacterized protein L969DRAFT_19811 [Mixia osmundae IAM 14324]|uniref:Palmitoyl-protein thioesterase 1 n=1 Tax=Mixia osmundae (strain CBS 9802 / IAM 14324 / JCM 22182 / KY 12970) TaxID=764103 RepID=G7E278_MIXOS|nr:uncharacterized protein L969DRAFT_19811 [Mixia osmundae IAM 14324]KEI36810.1 hypothetical protein L969DRAFT_19811 [Mixia osmundae IAM 14324]GAA96938.1 hypothetical protein E5Q_03612 [Mixia osmundae IAM 14324]